MEVAMVDERFEDKCIADGDRVVPNPLDAAELDGQPRPVTPTPSSERAYDVPALTSWPHMARPGVEDFE